MAANNSHTDVICLNNDQLTNVPSCPHGPALLFERYRPSSKDVQSFFACSAFRDRKACNFFRWADSVSKTGTQTGPQLKEAEGFETHETRRKRYFAFKKLPLSDRHICCSCGLLLLDGELSHHKSPDHVVKEKVKMKELRHPSYIFIPRENNKTFAQYLFSKKTVDFIMGTLSKTFSHVLCIGTPRLHEQIQSLREEESLELQSFLLDLDERYNQFYGPDQFSRYNMFNNYFFEKEGLSNLQTFLRSSKGNIAMMIDPPFGGMVEPLSLTLSKLSYMCQNPNDDLKDSFSEKAICVTPFFLFFPYFMEKRIVDAMDSVVMLDYKVEYDNHDLYKNVKKKGSPVRIFVPKSMESLQLPEEEGYWWCELCKRFSASENSHCKECNSCASKDGSTYVHCDMCLRCVKPSRKHCFTCSMCQVQDHDCKKVISTGCYICGDLEHKKRDCPKKTLQPKKGTLKRKSAEKEPKQGKKRTKCK